MIEWCVRVGARIDSRFHMYGTGRLLMDRAGDTDARASGEGAGP
jgi:hypothetical protein